VPRVAKIVIRNGTAAPSAGDFDVAEPAWDKTAGKLYIKNAAGAMVGINADDVIVVACSDEATAITSGAAKVTFRMPFAATLISVRASLTAATTGTEMQIDINKNGASVFSTTLRINAGELTSVGATTAPVFSGSPTPYLLADNDSITIDVDQVGTGAKGLKVHMYLRRT
jgi:hypothetical protein